MKKRDIRFASIPSTEEVAAERERLAYQSRYQRVLRSTIYILVVVAAVAVLLATLFLPVLQVSGDSMYPTLNDKDIILLVKSNHIENGELCGFYWQNKLLLKRIIGQPGDVIDMDVNGVVSVNGVALDEPYVDALTVGECDIRFPYQVPENRYFVLGDLSDSTLADQLVKYLPAVPAIAAQQDVNEEGYANITKLPQGLYLVVQTEASHGYEAIKPFLVSIPMPDGDNWIYDVDATPKVGATIPETPDTPDTPDVPDTPDTPDTPDLPEQPDNPDTPVSPGTPDNPVSPGTPDNPVSPENPDNPVSPSTPDKPVLPQTGQLNWPVPVLACSGVLLFAAGWVLNRQGKKEN